MSSPSTTLTPMSVLSRLAEHATARPNAVALRNKRRGIWQEITWKQLQSSVTETALGLKALGVQPGSTVAIFAENGPEWVISDLAIQRLGGIVLPILPQTSAAEISAWFSAHSVSIALCGDEEHVDKLLEADPVSLATLVVFNLAGLSRHPDARLKSFTDLVGSGLVATSIVDAESESVLRQQASDRIIGLDVSRADGGHSLPTELNAGVIESAAVGTAAWLGLTPTDRTMSIMPIADVVTRVADIYAPLHAGSQIHFSETLISVLDDLAQVSPTVLVGSRQVFDLLRGDAFVQRLGTGRARRRLIGWALDGGTSTGFGRAARWALVARPMALRHGVSRVRLAVVIGEDTIGRDTAAFLAALHVPLAHVWGSPETGGTALGFDGRSTEVVALAGTDRPELAARWRDGLTGAAASTDPARQAAILEHRLAEHPFVSRSVISAVGSGYRAVVELDFETVSAWANANSVDFTTRSNLSGNPAVRAIIADEIATINSANGSGQITALGIAPRAFTVAHGDVAPGLWLRRDVISATYADVVQPL